jgi:two-component system LytT family response regulator
VVVADDEPLARRKLRRLLDGDATIRIVAECGNGDDALRAIREHAPDLVFLDVRMPALDGFGVVAALPRDALPAIVFTTAYDEYAVRAFEVRALDYLVKPFNRARLREAVSRVRAMAAERRAHPIDDRLASLLDELRAERARPERLAVKHDGRTSFVAVRDIDWVEAADNYVRLHVGTSAHLLRETMAALEAKLDPARFIRIHRGTIVNVDRIQELQPWFRGDSVVILKNGRRLRMSRSYRDRLDDLTG